MSNARPEHTPRRKARSAPRHACSARSARAGSQRGPPAVQYVSQANSGTSAGRPCVWIAPRALTRTSRGAPAACHALLANLQAHPGLGGVLLAPQEQPSWNQALGRAPPVIRLSIAASGMFNAPRAGSSHQHSTQDTGVSPRVYLPTRAPSGSRCAGVVTRTTVWGSGRPLSPLLATPRSSPWRCRCYT